MKKIKGLWWKLAGIAGFLYVIVGGMLVPLRPGITAVTPSNVVAGETVSLTIKGYNTHFDEAKNQRSWLKLDSSRALAAINWKALDANTLQLNFRIPSSFPIKKEVHSLSLIMDNEVDGTFVQPNALFVSQKSDTTTFVEMEWNQHQMGNFSNYSGLQFPYRNILNETIRNTFFHVALWFAMFILLLHGLYHSIRYLQTGNFDQDRQAEAFTMVAILFGILGILTGSVWAKHTWNTYWTNDIKLNMTAIALLIYLAYLILRGMNYDQDKRARLAAVYNIFAFVALIPLVFVIPRLTDSLHPGNGGNPALGGEDLDNTLRLFFYPAIIALYLIGKWMAELITRLQRLKDHYFLQNSSN